MLFNKIKTLILLTAILALNACTTPAPTYRNLSPSSDDAHISFESDFELHTHFLANISGNTSCKSFKSTGYILKADSIFIYDKPNTEIEITAPAGKLIGVGGYHQYSDPGYTANCYPKSRFFIPEPNEKYVVKMNKVSQGINWKGEKKWMCYISVEKIDSNGSKEKVELSKKVGCTK
jgi:hypothetical protein